jgi:hypothetical protein
MSLLKTLSCLDWTPVFQRETLNDLSFKVVSNDTDFMNNETLSNLPSTRLKIIKSALRVLRIASITGSILTLAPVAITGGLGLLGISTVHAIGVSSMLTGSVYMAGSSTAVSLLVPAAQVSAQVGWEALIAKVLWIVEYLMDGVIIFSGVSWMFGNRTKAIELLLGSGVGYVIVRHHEDIKNFFALL